MTIRWLTIFIDLPAADSGPGVAFWQRVTGTTLSRWRGTAQEFATLLPADGDAYLRVQQVPAGRGGCHLDLHVDLAMESMDRAAARVAALGARLRRRDGDLAVFDSPGGFGFCLVPWAAEATVPGPVDGGPGGAYRLDQLCLDIPATGFEAECGFWASLTGWELRPGALAEFAYLMRPDGIAVRLLFQRRVVAGAGDPVTGHPDFACENAVGLAQRHTAVGANVTASFPHWVTMADPTGRPYCLTARDPRSGTLRATR